MRKTLATLSMAGLLFTGMAGVASAAPAPDGCTKDRGTVTCTTFEGPGNNQGGVGSTTTTETKGNTTNTSPEPQDLQSGCTYSPPKSKGAPNSC
jgi:hypothetical protein